MTLKTSNIDYVGLFLFLTLWITISYSILGNCMVDKSEKSILGTTSVRPHWTRCYRMVSLFMLLVVTINMLAPWQPVVFPVDVWDTDYTYFNERCNYS